MQSGTNQLNEANLHSAKHEVKKRKATRAKEVERKLKKGGPGLLIQSQHEKNKDLETRGAQEKRN